MDSYVGRQKTPQKLATVLRDYSLMSKPRIVVLAAVTVGVGYVAGAAGRASVARLGLCLVVMVVLAVACGILNQVEEADSDAEMERTVDRPIAGGRVGQAEATRVGILLSLGGVAGSGLFFGWLTCVAAGLVLLTYLVVYTPLKKVTFLGTVGGAVSGALPPLLGWFASGRGVDQSACWLFLFVFIWQFPHFLAISSVYEADYATGGYQMVPRFSNQESAAGFVATLYAATGIPAFVMLGATGLLGAAADAVGLWLSVVYLLLSMAMWRFKDKRSARRLMGYSLLFVTFVFAAIGYEHLASG